VGKMNRYKEIEKKDIVQLEQEAHMKIHNFDDWYTDYREKLWSNWWKLRQELDRKLEVVK
jgi:hypothetical protein